MMDALLRGKHKVRTFQNRRREREREEDMKITQGDTENRKQNRK